MDRIPSPRILTIDPNDENIILEIPEDKDPTAPETPAKKEKVSDRKLFCAKASDTDGWRQSCDSKIH